MRSERWDMSNVTRPPPVCNSTHKRDTTSCPPSLLLTNRADLGDSARTFVDIFYGSQKLPHVPGSPFQCESRSLFWTHPAVIWLIFNLRIKWMNKTLMNTRKKLKQLLIILKLTNKFCLFLHGWESIVNREQIWDKRWHPHNQGQFLNRILFKELTKHTPLFIAFHPNIHRSWFIP